MVILCDDAGLDKIGRKDKGGDDRSCQEGNESFSSGSKTVFENGKMESSAWLKCRKNVCTNKF